MLKNTALRTILVSVALGLASPTLHADVVVESALHVLDLEIHPFTGTIEFIPPRTGVVILTRAYNSTGGFIQALLKSLSPPVSLNVMVPGIHTEAVGNPSQQTGSVSGGMNLSNTVSGGGNASSILHGPFEIAGVTGPVSVSFSVMLSGSQSLDTSGGGRNASSDLSFDLKINGNSLLPFNSLLQIGSNNSASNSISQTLTGSLTLDGETPYTLDSRLAYQGLGNVPEPSFFILLGAGLGGMFLARSIRGRSFTMKG